MSWGNTHFYKVMAQDDFPPSADWKYDYKSSVSRSYKKPTLLPGLCPGRTACQCTGLTATAPTAPAPAPSDGDQTDPKPDPEPTDPTSPTAPAPAPTSDQPGDECGGDTSHPSASSCCGCQVCPCAVAPPVCCKANTASCLACTNGTNVVDYCARKPESPGCGTPVAPTDPKPDPTDECGGDTSHPSASSCCGCQVCPCAVAPPVDPCGGGDALAKYIKKCSFGEEELVGMCMKSYQRDCRMDDTELETQRDDLGTGGVADVMRDCTTIEKQDAATCKGKAKKKMCEVEGLNNAECAIFGDTDMEEKIREGGEDLLKKEMDKCMKAAGDDELKFSECVRLQGKAALAAGLGKDPAAVTDTELDAARNDLEGQVAADAVAVCFEKESLLVEQREAASPTCAPAKSCAAARAAASVACHAKGKAELEKFMGGKAVDATTYADTKNAGARDKVGTAIDKCMVAESKVDFGVADQKGALREHCQAKADAVLGAALGKDSTSMGDGEKGDAKKSAVVGIVKKKKEACAAAKAGNGQDAAAVEVACDQEARDKYGALTGKDKEAVTDGDWAVVKADAADDIYNEVMDACTGRMSRYTDAAAKECLANAKTAVEGQLGEQLGDGAFGKKAQDAATEKAGRTRRACMDANEAAATCDAQLANSFSQNRGEDGTGSVSGDAATAVEKIKADGASKVGASLLKACLAEGGTCAACKAEATGSYEQTGGTKKRANREIMEEAMADALIQVGACKKNLVVEAPAQSAAVLLKCEATVKAEVQKYATCMGWLEEGTDIKQQDFEDTVKEAAGSSAVAVAQECRAGKTQAQAGGCEQEAQDAFVAAGQEARLYQKERQEGLVNGAAEKIVACKEAKGTTEGTFDACFAVVVADITAAFAHYDAAEKGEAMVGELKALKAEVEKRVAFEQEGIKTERKYLDSVAVNVDLKKASYTDLCNKADEQATVTKAIADSADVDQSDVKITSCGGKAVARQRRRRLLAGTDTVAIKATVTTTNADAAAKAIGTSTTLTDTLGAVGGVGAAQDFDVAPAAGCLCCGVPRVLLPRAGRFCCGVPGAASAAGCAPNGSKEVTSGTIRQHHVGVGAVAAALVAFAAARA